MSKQSLSALDPSVKTPIAPISTHVVEPLRPLRQIADHLSALRGDAGELADLIRGQAELARKRGDFRLHAELHRIELVLGETVHQLGYALVEA